jgi:hypothetical protein
MQRPLVLKHVVRAETNVAQGFYIKLTINMYKIRNFFAFPQLLSKWLTWGILHIQHCKENKYSRWLNWTCPWIYSWLTVNDLITEPSTEKWDALYTEP